MEAGSLLQRALSQSVHHDPWHADHELWLDLYLLSPPHQTDPVPQVLELAKLARRANDFFQAQSFDWHTGGDGPVFGIHSSDGFPHLRAICRYGASIVDEWAAVDFVRQFTLSQKECEVAVECWDVLDGQLLLIESSSIGLPAWVDRIGPEACRHRCWIAKGQIHLIAPRQIQAHSNGHDMDLKDALETLRRGKTDSNIAETPATVQKAIQDCTARVMRQSSLHHKAVLAVPRPVGFLICQRPDLLNAATLAFAHQALHNLPTTPPKVPCEDWVWTTHSFSRTNYAMLRTLCSPTWKNESHVPKQYQSIELKRLQRQCAVEATPHLRHAVQIGVRLLAGLDTMLQQQQPQQYTPQQSNQERRACLYWPKLLQDGLGLSPHWILEAWQVGPHRAVHNLEYLLQCPVVQEELENAGAVTPLSHPETELTQQIRQLFKKADGDPRDYAVPRKSDVDANEDWMVLSHGENETLLGNARAVETGDHVAQLDTMLESFQSFMVNQSGVEGVAHEKKNNTKNATHSQEQQHEVNINPRVFLNLLQTVLDPSTKPDDIGLASSDDDAYFSKEDYDAMLPADEDDDENIPVDTDVVELMTAMDEELRGTKAGSTGGESDLEDTGISAQGGQAVEEAQILSNLLQSLDAGVGGRGPVKSMIKAMGQDPPMTMTTSVEDVTVDD